MKIKTLSVSTYPRYNATNASRPTAGKAIFGYGANNAQSTFYSMTNLVSNTGVVATDTTGVGTARYGPASAGYSTT